MALLRRDHPPRCKQALTIPSAAMARRVYRSAQVDAAFTRSSRQDAKRIQIERESACPVTPEASGYCDVIAELDRVLGPTR